MSIIHHLVLVQPLRRRVWRNLDGKFWDCLRMPSWRAEGTVRHWRIKMACFSYRRTDALASQRPRRWIAVRSRRPWKWSQLGPECRRTWGTKTPSEYLSFRAVLVIISSYWARVHAGKRSCSLCCMKSFIANAIQSKPGMSAMRTASSKAPFFEATPKSNGAMISPHFLYFPTDGEATWSLVSPRTSDGLR